MYSVFCQRRLLRTLLLYDTAVLTLQAKSQEFQIQIPAMPFLHCNAFLASRTCRKNWWWCSNRVSLLDGNVQHSLDTVCKGVTTLKYERPRNMTSNQKCEHLLICQWSNRDVLWYNPPTLILYCMYLCFNNCCSLLLLSSQHTSMEEPPSFSVFFLELDVDILVEELLC